MFVFSQKKRAPGDKLWIYDEAGDPLFFVDHPPLARLDGPTTVYADETRQTTLLTLFRSTPSLFGTGTAYLVLDGQGEKLATLRRAHGRLSGTSWRVYGVPSTVPAGQPPTPAGDKNEKNDKPARAALPPLLAEAHEEGHWKRFVRDLPLVRITGADALLRTNYVLTAGRNDKNKVGRVLGYFVRGFTVVEKFVLDLRPDATRQQLDRRIALALALVLEAS